MNIGLKRLLRGIIKLNLEKKLEQTLLKKFGMETMKKKNLILNILVLEI